MDTEVSVTVIFPGAIGTDIAVNSGVAGDLDLEAGGEDVGSDPLPADKAMRIMLDGIEKDRFRVLVGSDARTMDFFYRLATKRAANLIFNQMKSLLS